MNKDDKLWVEFADEVIPPKISDSELILLESVFKKALARLDCTPKETDRFFKLEKDIPSLDLNLLLQALSRSALYANRSESGALRISARNSFMHFLAMLKLQFRIERFLSIPTPAHSEPEESRIRSMALGICMQVLYLRLPRHSPKELSRWLMKPEIAPPLAQRTVRQLLGIQNIRNTLSFAWNGFFGTENDAPATRTLGQEEALPIPAKHEWEGLPVSPGQLESSYVLDPTSIPGECTVLIFSNARPETVRFFPYAQAVLYIRGGVLSHACCVARERKIPCITGLGREFLATLQQIRPARLRVDAEQGTVSLISPART